ncbi:MAG: hypothetical protein JOZ60_00440, partial [Verrucomicrobia bacterium]|nr:hypothetical protein [Verrucomicrobiota bacterium]
MIDYFALLGIERRPAINEESLKNAYFSRSESLGSVQAQAEELSSVNTAFRTIENPATRIQHLLQVEFGDARGGQIGSELGELFGSVVVTLQSADQQFGSLSGESSALLRALAFQRMDGVRERLQQTENNLLALEGNLLWEGDRLDRILTESRARCRESLAQIALRLT